jgi:hypothetical protein
METNTSGRRDRHRQAGAERHRDLLAWVLKEFVYGPLVSTSRPAGEQARLWVELAHLVDAATGKAWRADLPETTRGRPQWAELSPAAIKELALTQRVIRRYLPDGAANGMRWAPQACSLSGAYSQVSEPDDAPPFLVYWRGPLHEVIVPAIMGLLGGTPLSQLRVCRYRKAPKAPACGHLFVAVKRGEFCPQHADLRRRERDQRAQVRSRQRRRRRTRAGSAA